MPAIHADITPMKLGPIHIMREANFSNLNAKIKALRGKLDSVTKHDFKYTYRELVQDLKQEKDFDTAMADAVGGAFDKIGSLELAALRYYGLKPEDYVVDVGCGSGRLAKPLARFSTGPYLGIDVVPDLLDYARSFAPRSNWRFALAPGLSIPESDEKADLICFFSVFTHLRHEQSFLYLKDAHRIVKTGGKILFSFLEFAVPSHWDVFEGNIAQLESEKIEPLNQFMSRDLIEVWARRLGLRHLGIRSGDDAFLLPEGGDGIYSIFGQSICVLVKE
jgi:SAM-dependent methyltransferase